MSVDNISPVYSVAVSRDGTRIVAGYGDGTIRVWDGATGEAIGRPLKGHKSRVLAVAVSPGGSRIVSGDADGRVLIEHVLSSTSSNEPLPEDLAALLAEGRVQLIAGPELPTACGRPGRDGVLRTIAAADAGAGVDLPTGAQEQLLSGLERPGCLDRVATLLRKAFPKLDGEVADIYSSGDGGLAYAALAAIPFAGVISLCWDAGLVEATSA